MRRSRLILSLASILLIGGCEAVAIGVATPMVVRQNHVNLANASYAAADELVYRAGNSLNKDRFLVVGDLQEILDMNQKKIIANPKLGKVMSEQMRTRFMQLGYTVASTGPASDGPVEVTGTYEIVHSTMTVSLRMKDHKNGRTIALYDYSLPVTYEIKKYMADNANMLPPIF